MTNLVWERDGLDWPNRESSRFVEASGLRWHVQDMGSGPAIVLVHGTGASTHSWAKLAPLLAQRFRVFSFDLPGHGFTQSPPPSRMTLGFMANAVSSLLSAVDLRAEIFAGHSAGAAILARMSLDGVSMSQIVSINGALLPFGGVASHIFPALARLLFVNPFVPSFFAWRASGMNTVRNLIEGTGSKIDDRDLKLYARLFQSETHVAAALGMMANWDLASLQRELPLLKTRLTLIAATNDKAIPPDVAFKVQKLVPGPSVVVMRGLGHLCHEEKPEDVATILFEAAEKSHVS